MFKITEKRSVAVLLITISTLMVLFALSGEMVSASGGSIAEANYFPNDGGTYNCIDHFLMQISAVNTNTTVSVSFDGGQPIPLTYQGITNEIGSRRDRCSKLVHMANECFNHSCTGKSHLPIFQSLLRLARSRSVLG